jgi:hypothetical protein
MRQTQEKAQPTTTRSATTVTKRAYKKRKAYKGYCGTKGKGCKASKPRRDLHADITSRIVEALEQGAAPWVKPWRTTP